MQLRAVVEVQSACDLLHRGVQQNVLAVKDHYRVDDVLQIAHLMGGDHDGGSLGSVLHDRAPELRLGRNVQTVGRLIHEYVLASTGQGEGDVDLLQLSG